MNEFSHLDEQNRPKMVDVGSKKIQKRRAVASGSITLSPETIEKIKANEIKKGSVLTVAELAGITGAKKTSDLIPLCHPLALTHISVKADLVENHKIEVKAEAACHGQTGVEMEALTAVSIALLAIYDMCKAVDKQMIINEIKLLEKIKEDL